MRLKNNVRSVRCRLTFIECINTFRNGATTPYHRPWNFRCKNSRLHFRNSKRLLFPGETLRTFRISFPGILPKYSYRQNALSVLQQIKFYSLIFALCKYHALLINFSMFLNLQIISTKYNRVLNLSYLMLMEKYL